MECRITTGGDAPTELGKLAKLKRRQI
jgi:hypothetical protein